jgi:hypothetical protein
MSGANSENGTGDSNNFLLKSKKSCGSDLENFSHCPKINRTDYGSGTNDFEN